MAKYRAEIDAIMAEYNAGKITIDEANKKLDALDGAEDGKYGIGFHLSSDRAKGCNAWLDCGVGHPDPIKVENGKVVGGSHPSYAIYYQGKVWHTKDIGDDTLVEGPPEYERWSQKADPLPADIDFSRRKEFANTVKTQRTKKGTFEVTYDDLGYAVKATRV